MIVAVVPVTVVIPASSRVYEPSGVQRSDKRGQIRFWSTDLTPALVDDHPGTNRGE